MTLDELKQYTTVNWEEAEQDFGALLDRMDAEGDPIVICRNDVPSLLLIGWEDFWERFGALEPDGERERIEALCRTAWQEQEEPGELLYQPGCEKKKP